jgi:hypothetical protein
VSENAGARPRATRWRRTAASLGLVAFTALSSVSSDAQTARQVPAAGPVRINIRVTPIPAFESREPSRQRFGTLVYRGGLELAADNKDFGGFSTIRVAADGARFLAVSDKGRWLSARIIYHGTRPVGIADAEIAPVLGPDGRPIQARGWYDTEAMAEDGGTIYLGLERVHRILRFDYGKSGLAARGAPITVPQGMRTMPSNKGIDALAVVPKGHPLAGTLVAISEAALDASGNVRGFLIGGRSPGEFTVRRTDDFDISDCAITPRGDLLLLERRYSLWRGVATRIRRIALAQLAPNALLDGPAILEADMGFQVDNMEGLSVHRGPGGETVLTLISDDNFSLLQRTLLLQFTLLEPE